MHTSYRLFEVAAHPDPDGHVHLFSEPTREEEALLLDRFRIDPHSIASAMDPDEVGRFEVNERELDLIWKVPVAGVELAPGSFGIESMGMFLRGQEMVIIGSPAVADLVSASEVKHPIRLHSPLDLMLSIQHLTLVRFLDHLKLFKRDSRAIQRQINQAMENASLIRMFELSERLVYYLDAIESDQLVLERFRDHVVRTHHGYRVEVLSDLMIEAAQAAKQAQIYSQVFAELMDARGTIVNNNMNVLIKNLTVINIIFLPLSLIAGIGGMSEFSAVTTSLPLHVSYGLLMIGLSLIGAATWWLLVRNTWRS